jgi:hypothetical protein
MRSARLRDIQLRMLSEESDNDDVSENGKKEDGVR